MNAAQAEKNRNRANRQGYTHFEGLTCDTCGNTKRFVRGKACVFCNAKRAKGARKKWQEKQKRERERKKEVYTIKTIGGFQL